MNKPDAKTLEEVQLLFEFVPPKRLRKQITFLLMQYIINNPPNVLPIDTPKLAEDVQFLLDFIDRAGKNSKRS